MPQFSGLYFQFTIQKRGIQQIKGFLLAYIAVFHYFPDNEGDEHFQRCLELGVRHWRPPWNLRISKRKESVPIQKSFGQITGELLIWR